MNEVDKTGQEVKRCVSALMSAQHQHLGACYVALALTNEVEDEVRLQGHLNKLRLARDVMASIQRST